MVLLTADTTGAQLTTMDDLIVPSILGTDWVLVAGPQREALALSTAVTMAEETHGTTMIGPCEHHLEMLEDPFNPLHDGSPKRVVTLGKQETLETIASVPTIGDIQCRQVRSQGEHLPARVSHRSTMHTNAMRHHLDISRTIGKMSHRLGLLRTCQHPRMVPRSIPLELL